MKLTNRGSATFPKFTNVGDKVEGEYVRFDLEVPGKFGPKNVITLKTPDGILCVNAPKALSDTFLENEEHLTVGRMVTITFTGTKIIGAGKSPMKLFDVELGGVEAGDDGKGDELHARGPRPDTTDDEYAGGPIDGDEIPF